MTMLPRNWETEYRCKSEWQDKPFKAVCRDCEAVVHGGRSEAYCNRRAREHANTLDHDVSVRFVVEAV